MINLSMNALFDSTLRTMRVASMIDIRKLHLLFRKGANRRGRFNRPVEFPLFARQRAQAEKVAAMSLATGRADAAEAQLIQRRCDLAERAKAEIALAAIARAPAQAEQQLVEIAARRTDSVATVQSAAPKKSPSRESQTPKNNLRVGLSAAVALIVGIAAGYWVKTPPVPVNPMAVAPVVANKAANTPSAVPMPGHTEGELQIKLRLDTELKSLSRSVPAAHEVNKLR